MNMTAVKIKEHRAIDVETASKLWNEGQSAADIGKLFGVSRSTVLGFAQRNRELFPPKQQGRASMTPKVAGKRYRAPMTPEQRLQKYERAKALRAIQRQNRPKEDRARMLAADDEAEEFQKGTSRFLRVHRDDQQRLANGKSLFDLEPCECRWPLNQGGPFIFCSETTAARSSYCPDHLERSLPSPEYRRLKEAA